MTTQARYKRHIIVVILLALGGVVSVFGVYKGVLYLETQLAETVKIEERIASYGSNKKIFENESLALRDLEARVENVESYIVTTTTTPAFLSSLEALAISHGVEFTITSAQTLGKQKDKLTVDFAASGDMASITGFLRDLGKQTYQIKFAKLALVSDRTTTGQWSVLGSIQVVSFGL